MNRDEQLVNQAVAGDRQAAAELIERHAACVYAVCLGLLADPDQAQDLAHDALLKSVSRLVTLQKPAAYRSWLITIARNLCRDAWQQTRRHRELLTLQVDTALASSGPGTAAIPGLGIGAPTADQDVGPDLSAALARLPESHRLPLLLFYFDGLSTSRVAEALDITPAAAATRLCRARRALREILEVAHD